MTPLTAVVADDAPLLREGIASVLRAASVDVVAEARDADELLAAVRALRPDVAVVDIRMPPTNTDDGLRAALLLRQERSPTGLLLLSQYVEEAYARDLLADGADGIGYLLKDRVGDLGHFVDAVRQVAAGGSVLDPEVVARFLGRRRPGDPLATLSPRERQVLGLVAEGRTNAAIGRTLYLSDGAVEKNIRGIFTKLHLRPAADDHRRVLAVLAYLDGG